MAQMEAKRNTYRILKKNPERKIPLGRPRFKWVDNIQMYHRNRIGWY
jgi:hypothetical protein